MALPRGWRNLILLSLFLLLLLMVFGGNLPGANDVGGSSDNSPPATGPNVLIIVTDDQRAGTLDRMSSVRTLFKKHGVSYPNAFATTPVCCPARASLMSGRYAHNHGVERFTAYRLDQSTTIQRYLSDKGYRTAYFGKYLNGWKMPHDPPYFQDWAIFPQTERSTYVGGKWNVNGTINRPRIYSTRFIEDRAFRFLAETEVEGDSTPWLMYVSTPAPHEPYAPQDKYRQAAVGEWPGNPAVFDDVSDKPFYIKEGASEPCDLSCGMRVRARQYRALYSVDDLVGRLFAQLKNLGESRNTLAFFLSDNGVHWGEFGMEGKRLPYTPSVNIPMLMRWPRKLDARIDRRLVANIDIAPTILGAIGRDPRTTEMDGRSLLRRWTRKHLLLEYWGPAVSNWSSIRSKRFQYIEYQKPGPDRDGVGREYYDLSTDPWQLTNLLFGRSSLSAPTPDRIERLARLLSHARTCRGHDCP
jgi:arylsulfatase A-like enzyme